MKKAAAPGSAHYCEWKNQGQQLFYMFFSADFI
jgi:hypothetical protein